MKNAAEPNPEDWIELETKPRETKGAEKARAFLELMSTRRSLRHFSSDPVDDSILRDAIQTASQAPSGANQQPWFFALIQSSELKEKIRTAAEKVEHEFYHRKAPGAWLDALKIFNTNETKPYLTEAPALIAVFSRTSIQSASDVPTKTYYPLESTAISVGFLIAALHNAGVATLTHTPQPLFFLNELLGLDRTYRPLVIVVAGYPKDQVKVPRLRRKRPEETMSVF